MKTVLIINDMMVGGGAENVMQNIVFFLHNKYRITVMTLDDDSSSFKTLFPADVTYQCAGIKKNSFSRLNPWHYCLSIYNRFRMYVIQTQKFDIVIANKEGSCMKLVSKMRAKRKLAWVHVDYRYLYWTKNIFETGKEVECMKKFDSVVCVSQAAADSVKEVIGDPGNLVVRYNPLNYRLIEEKVSEKIDICRESNKLLFVSAGRIVEQKNFKALAGVCAKLSREFDFELWIVGDGDERKDVEMILQDEQCSCVKILGMKRNPYPYIIQADFYVSASLWESYGLAIQEALVLGVPVLATRCPAIEECLDERFGIKVDCDDESIEQGMRYILEYPECVNRYKNAIQKYYDKKKLWIERLRSIEKLLN